LFQSLSVLLIVITFYTYLSNIVFFVRCGLPQRWLCLGKCTI